MIVRQRLDTGAPRVERPLVHVAVAVRVDLVQASATAVDLGVAVMGKPHAVTEFMGESKTVAVDDARNSKGVSRRGIL